MSSGWQRPTVNQSITGGELSIGGKKYETGIGTHASSALMIQLGGRATSFKALVGMDDNRTVGTPGSIEFKVYGDGKELWESGLCRPGEEARECEVALDGISYLDLVVTDANDGIDSNHAVWANPKLTYRGAAPLMGPPPAPEEEPYILKWSRKTEPVVY